MDKTISYAGYYISCGYMGRVAPGVYMLFATESEYKEYMEVNYHDASADDN